MNCRRNHSTADILTNKHMDTSENRVNPMHLVDKKQSDWTSHSCRQVAITAEIQTGIGTPDFNKFDDLCTLVVYNFSVKLKIIPAMFCSVYSCPSLPFYSQSCSPKLRVHDRALLLDRLSYAVDYNVTIRWFGYWVYYS